MVGFGTLRSGLVSCGSAWWGVAGVRLGLVRSGMARVFMIALSERATRRINNLFNSQRSRAQGKQDKNGRIIKQGYVLPFDRKQFTAWLLNLFHGEDGAIACPFCRAPIDLYSCQLDHGIPLKRGGSPGLENIDATCAPCNAVKGQLTPEEFDSFLAKMRALSDEFHNGFAVKNITHRLESYSGLKANINRAHASRAKQQVAAVVEEDF